MAQAFIDVEVEGLEAMRVIPRNAKKVQGKELAKTLVVAADAFAIAWKFTTSGPRSATKIGVRSGALRGGIHRVQIAALEQEVSTPVPYALAQEHGYPPRNLPARPHMAPAEKMWRPIAKKIFEGRVDEAGAKLQRMSDRIRMTDRRRLGK
jgi:hypothetical protein